MGLLDPLRQVVIGLAAMSEADLRKMKEVVRNSEGPAEAKELVLDLIDLFLAIGPDAEERAKAAAACMMAIDEVEQRWES